MTNRTHKNSGNMAPLYVQVTLGKTRLLFPGAELLSLEANPEIRTNGADGRIGVVKLNEAILPVYNFDEHFHPHGEVQEKRCACVCLGNGGAAFALLCDNVETLEGADIQIVALPACMRSEFTPVQSLALQGTRIFCVSSVERFAGMIEISSRDETSS